MDINYIAQMIRRVREKSGYTQEQLAVKLNVSAQAVSKWENGKNLPDIENLMLIAELTNTPYAVLLSEQEEGQETEFTYRSRLFNEENMYTRLKTTAEAEGLEETYRALDYMRTRHMGQYRNKQKHTEDLVAYINHPLTMACQAHAYGIKDDALLAAILLHDVVEDTGVSLEELPFSDEVKEIVGLVTFTVPDGMSKAEAKDIYYQKIAENGKACVVKIIDRCNNVSTMAASFTRERMIKYINETEKYVLPLTDILQNTYPEYSDLSFLVKYQIISVIETIKNML